MSTKSEYSVSDMLADIASEKYRKDPDFRAEVERKVAGMNSRPTGKQFQSGLVDLGPGNGIGGFSFEDTRRRSYNMESGTSLGIDPTAVYVGEGFTSAEDIIRAVNSEEYRRNPTFRELVARGYEAMGPPIDRKV